MLILAYGVREVNSWFLGYMSCVLRQGHHGDMAESSFSW